jgi:hypothetical protein
MAGHARALGSGVLGCRRLRWRVYESTLELHPNLVMAHIELATALTFHGA